VKVRNKTRRYWLAEEGRLEALYMGRTWYGCRQACAWQTRAHDRENVPIRSPLYVQRSIDQIGTRLQASRTTRISG
jgi:hypothetical protein